MNIFVLFGNSSIIYTLMIAFPVFAPVNNSMKAWGILSNPFVMCSRYFILPCNKFNTSNERTSFSTRVFHKLDEIGNNAIIGISSFTMWKQNIPVTKCYPSEYWIPGPPIPSPTLPFWAPLDFWLYQELKVSVVQANAKLIQKGEIRGPGVQYSLG